MFSPRNIYRNEIDFAELAAQSPSFASHLKQNNQLDFSDPNAVRELTQALLRRDFGLRVELPDDRLCPPVPNRLNYILWLQDLVDSTALDSSYPEHDREVIGLDIGTGASAIYPLLGCSARPAWRFVATDIDERSLEYARQNVDRNNFQSRVDIVQTSPNDALLDLERLPVDFLTFTMCNPPFYESTEELISAAEAKMKPPFSACTGSVTEMVTKGGEVAFVSRMIDESTRLKDAVQWYTSMLGKLNSVQPLVEKLQKLGNSNWAVTEFVQGKKTKRWAIAWSWKDLRPTMEVARNHMPAVPKHLLPFPSEFTVVTPEDKSLSQVAATVNAELSGLKLLWEWNSAKAFGYGFAEKSVWSRQERRKRTHDIDASKVDASIRPTAALGFKIALRFADLKQQKVEVLVRWIKGSDNVLFESFCGMLKRKIQGR